MRRSANPRFHLLLVTNTGTLGCSKIGGARPPRWCSPISGFMVWGRRFFSAKKMTKCRIWGPKISAKKNTELFGVENSAKKMQKFLRYTFFFDIFFRKSAIKPLILLWDNRVRIRRCLWCQSTLKIFFMVMRTSGTLLLHFLDFRVLSITIFLLSQAIWALLIAIFHKNK